MYLIIGIIQAIILSFILVKLMKKRGISILGDGIVLMLILWLVNISLYNLQLSKLYKPNWQINIIVFIICILFYFISKKIWLEENDIILIVEEIQENKNDYNIYSIITNTLFVIAFIVFWINVSKYGLAILEKNKIDKQRMDHYAGYIVYMLVLCSQIKYILFRARKKISDLIIFILSVGTLALTLNRGPIAFIFSAIYIYEIFNLIKIKKQISKKKLYTIYGVMIITLIVLLNLFAYIGDMRMEYVLENVYYRTLNEHYKVPESVPSYILWAYIYLTSPLENIAFSLVNQSIQFTFFNNLFYPFIKFGANILGMGTQYKYWLESRGAYIPYLDDEVGLNVSSFISDAMQDLGYIGVLIYIGIFIIFAYFGLALIKKKVNFSALGRIVIYANILNILFWSVFDNSLRIPILLLNIIFVVFIELLREKFFGINKN